MSIDANQATTQISSAIAATSGVGYSAGWLDVAGFYIALASVVVAILSLAWKIYHDRRTLKYSRDKEENEQLKQHNAKLVAELEELRRRS